MARDISNIDNIIDSRDVIKRIAELETDLESTYEKEGKDRIEELTVDFKEQYEERCEVWDSIKMKEKPTFEDWLANSQDIEAKELLKLQEEEGQGFEGWLEDSNEDDAVELKSLKDLAEEGEQCSSDWVHGVTLIREDYFVEYAEELCKEISDLPKDIPGYIVIDWEATAENLKVDYSEVDFDGTTYLVR